MDDKIRNYQKELEAILDGLADYIETVPGEHLLEDARAGGEDLKQTVDLGKATLLQAVTDFEQKKLKAARRAYEERIAAMEATSHVLPDDPRERRQQLFAMLGQKPDIGAAFTARHRDFSKMTDDDVESALKELAELGVLYDVEKKHE